MSGLSGKRAGKRVAIVLVLALLVCGIAHSRIVREDSFAKSGADKAVKKMINQDVRSKLAGAAGKTLKNKHLMEVSEQENNGYHYFAKVCETVYANVETGADAYNSPGFKDYYEGDQITLIVGSRDSGQIVSGAFTVVNEDTGELIGSQSIPEGEPYCVKYHTLAEGELKPARYGITFEAYTEDDFYFYDYIMISVHSAPERNYYLDEDDYIDLDAGAMEDSEGGLRWFIAREGLLDLEFKDQMNDIIACLNDESPKYTVWVGANASDGRASVQVPAQCDGMRVGYVLWTTSDTEKDNLWRSGMGTLHVSSSATPTPIVTSTPKVTPTPTPTATPIKKKKQTLKGLKSFTRSMSDGSKYISPDGNYYNGLSFKSSNTSVVKISGVSSYGATLIMKKPGKAKITVTAKGSKYYKKATKSFTVKVVPGRPVVKTKLKKVKGGLKYLTITWKKAKGAKYYSATIEQVGVKKSSTPEKTIFKTGGTVTPGKKYRIFVTALDKTKKYKCDSKKITVFP